jgi:hypothetical protein
MLFTKENHQTEPGVDRINDGKTHVFNLIILDESGSMGVIEQQARSGCNEVLSGIRKAQSEHPDLVQHIYLLPFSTGQLHYIFNNVDASVIHDIDKEYNPSGCTALYDAMGMSLKEMEREADKYTDSLGVVTVITDGEENSSVEFSGKMIFDIVEQLKKKGWTFAFMGANQDVLKVAQSLNIKNAHEFEYTAAGTTAAFDMESRARGRFWDRIEKLRKSTKGMSMEERQECYAQTEADTDYYENN